MTTARRLIQGALKSIGVLDPAETMSAEDGDDGLEVLNDLIDAWNLERLYLYTTTEVVASFSGTTATIGVGMTINTPRPVEIESGFFRIGGIDYPLEIIQKPQYDSITLKSTLTGYPDFLYYDGGAPTGNVFIYPGVGGATAFHLTVLQQLSAFADLDTDYALPQGYARTLRYSLAEEMAPLHSREPSATVTRLAMLGRKALRRANDSAPLQTIDSATERRFNILAGQ